MRFPHLQRLLPVLVRAEACPLLGLSRCHHAAGGAPVCGLLLHARNRAARPLALQELVEEEDALEGAVAACHLRGRGGASRQGTSGSTFNTRARDRQGAELTRSRLCSQTLNLIKGAHLQRLWPAAPLAFFALLLACLVRFKASCSLHELIKRRCATASCRLLCAR